MKTTHVRPNTLEESGSVVAFWRLYGGPEGKVTYASLSRKLKKLYSPETIANAVKFHSMPQYVKDEVDNGNLSYIAAIELNRLYDAGCPDNMVKRFLEDAVSWSMSSKQVRQGTFKLIDFYQAEKKGQSSLFNIDLQESLNNKILNSSRDRFIKGYSDLAKLFSQYTSHKDKNGEDVSFLYSDAEVAGVLRNLLPHAEDVAHIVKSLGEFTSAERNRLITASKDIQEGLDNIVRH